MVLPFETSWPSKRVKIEMSGMLLSACSRSASTLKMPFTSALSRTWLSTGPCTITPGPAANFARRRAASSSWTSPVSMCTTWSSPTRALATTGQSALVRIRPLSSKTRWWSSGTSSVCARTAPSMPSALKREPRSDSAFTPPQPGRASGRPASHGAPPPFARGSRAPSPPRSGRRGRGRSVRGLARSRVGRCRF